MASKVRTQEKTGVKETNFGFLNKLIDDLITNLGKEGADDEKQKEYCEREFSKADDEEKSVQDELGNKEAAITEAKDQIASLGDEVSVLKGEITDLDNSVAQATLQRKQENQEFTQSMTMNEAAVQLLEKARQRLFKFYNPVMYKEPPKKELSMEDKIYVAGGRDEFAEGASLVEVRAHSNKVAPPPPPATVEAYTKKGEKSTGVVALMDMLTQELKNDMENAEHDEKSAESEYKAIMDTSAETRKQNVNSITDKEAAKADLENKLEELKKSKMLTFTELTQSREYMNTLHGSCDFIMENFDLRKEARTSEGESLKSAKAVLAGASFQ